MQFEHFALNVPDPRAMARWYEQHLRMTAVVAGDEPPYGQFLADCTGRIVMELYCKPAVAMPDYAQLDAMQFHVAFVTADVTTTRDALVAAGGKLESDEPLPGGGRMAIVRDPWGLAVQLIRRGQRLGERG